MAATISDGDKSAASQLNNVIIAERLLALLLFFSQAGVTVSNPGVAYTEADATARTKIPFDKITALYARIVGKAQGNEAGASKGLEIYDNTGTQQICEHEWDGNALTDIRGAWTDITGLSLSADSEIYLRVKGATGTEDITIYKAEFQLRYKINHS